MGGENIYFHASGYSNMEISFSLDAAETSLSQNLRMVHVENESFTEVQ